MKQKERPKITRTLIKENNQIVKMVIKKVVASAGTSGRITVPKELIGKYVEVRYDKSWRSSRGKNS